MINKYIKLKSVSTGFAMITVALLLLTVTACEDQLETKVFSQLTPENFYQSEGDFNAAVVTLYSPFGSDWGATDVGGGGYYPNLYNANFRTYLMRSMLTTDEMENDNPGTQELFTWGPATWQGNDETYFRIRFVARATDTIDNMTKSTSVSDEIKAKYIAQAKVLRAWMMYVLYDFYGPVNAKYDAATLADTEIRPRPSDAEYTGQIEKDLIEAIPDLDDMYNDDAANWGRMSKGVARMLLLKLYMHTKQWAKAEATGKEIISMGYALQSDYASIFVAQRNHEVIFAIDCADATGSRNWYPQHLFPPDYASSPIVTRGAGWYTDRMPWEFYDKYESNDERKETIIASYTNASDGITDRNTGLEGPIPLKYTGIVGSGNGGAYPDDVMVFRLGEVYLSVAEAINELRGPDEAYAFVNPIRARAKVSDFAGMTATQFRDAILDERGRELYAEGVRRQDLIRHGKFVSKAQERGLAASDKHILFPIPVNVINESNGVIEQNPGYTTE
jgi:starch-binding outer membrane protein, SusD/RagB family